MAQTIKLKRSATQGSIPATSALSLGEVAINTYDGKMYIKKNVGGTESIVEIGGQGGGIASSFTLYEYTATSGQTTFSGSDSNSNTLAYDTATPPKILVYLNGVLLDHTTDYTATNGTSVVLTNGAATSDLLQIAAYKSSVSTTLDIDLSDNQKLLLGDDDDLQIYHDGSNSWISEGGTGSLIVGADNFYIRNAAGTESKIDAISNGAVNLYYDNSKKFETTTTGINVSGAIIANGGGNQSVIKSSSDAPLIVESTDAYSGINFKDTGGNSSMYYLGSSDHLYLHSAKFSVAGSTIAAGYQFQVNGSANLTGSLAIGGAQVIAASTRNLTNIGTISSGAITSSGQITAKSAVLTDDGSGSPLLKISADDNAPWAIQLYREDLSGGPQVYASNTSTWSFQGNIDLRPTYVYKLDGTTVIDSNSFRGLEYIRHQNSSNIVMTMNHDTYTMLRNPLGTTRIWIGSTGYNGASSDDNNYYNAGTHFIRDSSSVELARISSNGVDAKSGGFLINGTSVINSSRNIHNVGTISSGAITSSGNITGSNLSVTSTNWIGFGDYGERISGSNASSTLDFYTDATLALRFNSTQDATFEGNIVLNSNGKVVEIADAAIQWYSYPDSAYKQAKFRATDYQFKNGGNTPVMTISSAGNIVASGTISSGNITAGNSSTAAFLRAHYNDGSYMTLEGYGLEMNRGASYIRPSTDNNKILYIGGADASLDWNAIHFRSGNGLYMTGTRFIDSGRNLENIGTISSGNITTSGYLAGPATFTIDPAAVGDNTGTVVIAGNLQVDGTTTTINSTTLTVDDKNITLASGSSNAAAANGAGLTVDCGSDTDATLTYLSSGDKWQFNKELVVQEGSSAISFTEYSNGATIWLDGSNGDFTGGDYFNISAFGTTDLAFGYGAATKITMKNDGKLGIGTGSPNEMLQINSADSAIRVNTTNAANNSELQLLYNNNTSHGMIFRYHGNSALAYIDNTYPRAQGQAYGDILFRQNYAGTMTEHMRLTAYDGFLGIGTNTPKAKLQVEVAGIDTTTTSTTATTQVAIDTFAAATFRSARYTIQVTNSTDSTYHLTEVLLIHDGTTPQITEYGTIFTGSAEATFDADISSGNVRLLATPATTDSMTFKVVRHCITV